MTNVAAPGRHSHRAAPRKRLSRVAAAPFDPGANRTKTISTLRPAGLRWERHAVARPSMADEAARGGLTPRTETLAPAGTVAQVTAPLGRDRYGRLGVKTRVFARLRRAWKGTAGGAWLGQTKRRRTTLDQTSQALVRNGSLRVAGPRVARPRLTSFDMNGHRRHGPVN